MQNDHIWSAFLSPHLSVSFFSIHGAEKHDSMFTKTISRTIMEVKERRPYSSLSKSRRHKEGPYTGEMLGPLLIRSLITCPWTRAARLSDLCPHLPARIYTWCLSTRFIGGLSGLAGSLRPDSEVILLQRNAEGLRPESGPDQVGTGNMTTGDIYLRPGSLVGERAHLGSTRCRPGSADGGGLGKKGKKK